MGSWGRVPRYDRIRSRHIEWSTPKDLSGLMILLINTLMTMSSVSDSGSGVPQEGCPPHAEKVGITMYWRSKGK